MKSKSITHQQIQTFGKLGKEIKISPKSNVTVNKPMYSKQYLVDSIEILIGIGKDHTASLVMSTDAWKALKKKQKIHITTNKEFKKSFL